MPSGFSPQEVYKKLKIKNHTYTIAHLGKLNQLKLGNPDRLPFSIKVLLESAIRNCDNYQITQQDVMNILNWSPRPGGKDISFKPGRVILQDFTGVPCVVDLATMRSAMKNLGGDYHKINPQVQCDLVIDHSVQVDAFGSKNALARNVHMEFKRNKERYEFLKWGQKAFKNFRVVPPATGIVHQINLEYLAKGVLQQKHGEATLAFPDSCVGTDSHTTMINGLGVVGWGVGGIEAEAVMLGEPICMLLPEVVGFKLTGNLKEGVTATDLVLTVTQMLRKKGVVGKFVEFYLKHAKTLVKEVGYIPFPDETYQLALTRFQKRVTGSVFGGQGSTTGVSIDELGAQIRKDRCGKNRPTKRTNLVGQARKGSPSLELGLHPRYRHGVTGRNTVCDKSSAAAEIVYLPFRDLHHAAQDRRLIKSILRKQLSTGGRVMAEKELIGKDH